MTTRLGLPRFLALAAEEGGGREGGLKIGWTKQGLPPRRPVADVGQDRALLGEGLDPRLPAQTQMSKAAIYFAFGPARQ